MTVGNPVSKRPDDSKKLPYLLPPGTRTTTAELLRLHPPRVRDEEGTIVSDESLFQLESGGSVLVFGVKAGKISAKGPRRIGQALRVSSSAQCIRLRCKAIWRHRRQVGNNGLTQRHP